METEGKTRLGIFIHEVNENKNFEIKLKKQRCFNNVDQYLYFVQFYQDGFLRSSGEIDKSTFDNISSFVFDAFSKYASHGYKQNNEGVQ